MLVRLYYKLSHETIIFLEQEQKNKCKDFPVLRNKYLIKLCEELLYT